MNAHYSVREVADIYKVSRKHIYNLIKSGRLGHIVIGQAIRVSEKDIENFERQNHKGIKRQERINPF